MFGLTIKRSLEGGNGLYVLREYAMKPRRYYVKRNGMLWTTA
jgi:hypothetical protein